MTTILNLQTRTKYGFNVIESVEGEKVRPDICLCLHCARMTTPEQAEAAIPDDGNGNFFSDDYERTAKRNAVATAFNCPVAEKLYKLCQQTGIAAPITRCPMFVPKDGVVVNMKAADAPT